MGSTAKGGSYSKVLRQSTMMVWSGTRSNLPKVEQLQFLQVGANGGQWSARIEDIDKSSSHDESWDMGKEEELIGRK